MIGLTYWSIIDPTTGLLVYILILLIDGLVLFSYILSVIQIKKGLILEKDIKNQMVDKVKGKPYKIKFVTESIRGNRHVVKYNSGIKIFFNNDKKLILILAYYFPDIDKDKKNKIINELMKKELDLRYYINSKVIVSGAESYKKIIDSMK
jgi:hypothetical protein